MQEQELPQETDNYYVILNAMRIYFHTDPKTYDFYQSKRIIDDFYKLRNRLYFTIKKIDESHGAHSHCTSEEIVEYFYRTEYSKKNLNDISHSTNPETAKENKSPEDSVTKGMFLRDTEISIKESRFTNLVTNIRRFLAKKKNPEGYEVADHVYSALRELSREHVDSKTHNRIPPKIMQETKTCQLFTTSRDDFDNFSNPDSIGKQANKQKSIIVKVYKTISAPNRVATEEDLANTNSISTYFPQKRKDTLEYSTIITPQNTRKLVLEILTALNGWVPAKIIKNIALKHVAPFTYFYTDTELSTQVGDVASFLEQHNFTSRHIYTVDDTDIEDYDRDQIALVTQETCERFWAQLCKLKGDEIFCLHILPKSLKPLHSEDTKIHPLRDFGATSTVGDKNQKITEIWNRELKHRTPKYKLIDFSRLPADRMTIFGIINQLNHKCIDQGYDPCLQKIVEDKNDIL